jgi:hypothetical protein
MYVLLLIWSVSFNGDVTKIPLGLFETKGQCEIMNTHYDKVIVKSPYQYMYCMKIGKE